MTAGELRPGGHFGIKISVHQYGKSHYEDKMVVKMVSQQSYLYNGNAYTWIEAFYIEMGPSRPSSKEHKNNEIICCVLILLQI